MKAVTNDVKLKFSKSKIMKVFKGLSHKDAERILLDLLNEIKTKAIIN